MLSNQANVIKLPIRKKVKIEKITISQPTKTENTNTNTLTLSNRQYTIKTEKDKEKEITLFSNKTGYNNCYINVVVQLLYHSIPFKDKLMKIDFLSQTINHNPLEQLKTLFKFYDISLEDKNTPLLDVSKFREEMNYHFRGFESKIAGDPIEVIQQVLNSIHSFTLNSPKISDDIHNKCIPYCPSHEFFTLEIEEKIECLLCKKFNNIKYDSNCFVYEIYTWEIFSSIINRAFSTFKRKLFNIYHEITTSFDSSAKVNGCKCNKPSLSKKMIFNEKRGENIILNLVWESFMPKMVDKWKFYNLIDLEDSIHHLFDCQTKTNYYLYGMILFWNSHYTCAIKSKNISENKWYFIDDFIQKDFYSFKDLLHYCINNEYHPIILFYSKNAIYQNGKEKKDTISTEEYNTMFNYCYQKDKSRSIKKTPSKLSTKIMKKMDEIIQKSSLKNSSFIRKSSVRTSSTGGSNICVYDEDDKWICCNCQEEKKYSSIKCSKCGGRRVIAQKSSRLKNEPFVSEFENIKMVNSIHCENGQTDIRCPTKEFDLNEQIGQNYIKSCSPTSHKDIVFNEEQLNLKKKIEFIDKSSIHNKKK